MKLGILIGATCFAAGVTVAMAVAAFPVHDSYQLQATDHQGNLYIAGSGDDCAATFKGAQLPIDWRELTCVKVK